MNLQDLRSELDELAEEVPPSSPPPVALIRRRRRRRVQLKAAVGGVPLLAAALVVFMLVQPGESPQTVTVGPTTPPASTAPPSSLVAAGLQTGGTNDITVISTATGATLKRLDSGFVLYSGSALATTSDGSVYFASYSSSGVSMVSPSGTVTSVAPGATHVAVSQDGRYVAAYNGPLVSEPNGPAPTVDVIERSSGQTRTFDLAQVLGSGYTVTGLSWAGGSETAVADVEIIPPAPSCAAPTTPQKSNCPIPTPQKPALVFIDAASAVLSAQVATLQSPAALVGNGPSPNTVALEVTTSDPNTQSTRSELVTAQLDGQSLSKTPLASLPSDAEAVSLDPAGTHLLYLQGYNLEYATIAHNELTQIRQIPGRYVTATWAPPTQSSSSSAAQAAPSLTSCPTAGTPVTVPSVIGLTAETAYTRLEAAGLIPNTRPAFAGPTGSQLPSVEAGSVVSEQPAPGSKTAVGSVVTLQVAVNSTTGSGGGYLAPPTTLPADWCGTK